MPQKAESTNVTTTYSYEYWDSAQQKQIVKTASNPSAPGWAPGDSAFTYNANGHLVQVVNGGRTISYDNSAQGLVLRRNDGGATKYISNFYYAAGRRIGDVSTDPTARDNRISYAETLARDLNVKPEDRYKNVKPVTSADFDQNYEPINANYPGSVGVRYTVCDGDTLSSIAQAVWGDAAMWYLIAEANGLSANDALVAGQVLVIPNKVTNIHNNANTFRPYNPGEAIGNVDPTLPEPPPPPQAEDGCGGMGQFIVIAVTFAVNAALPGAGSILGTMLNAGIAAAAGQAVGVAVGAVDHFDWNAVGQAALTAGVAEGVGQGLESLTGAGGALNGTAFGDWYGAAGNTVGRAMVNSALSTAAQQIVRGEWSWQAIAANAVGTGAGVMAGEWLAASLANTALQDVSKYAAQLTASGVSAATSSQLMGDSWAATRSKMGAAFAGSLGGMVGTEIRERLNASATNGGTGLRGPRGDSADWWNKGAPFDNDTAATDYSLGGPRRARLGGDAGSESWQGQDNRSLLNAVERQSNPAAYASRAGQRYMVEKGDTYSALAGNDLAKVGLWSTVNGDLKAGVPVWLDDVEQFSGAQQRLFRSVGGALYASDNARLATMDAVASESYAMAEARRFSNYRPAAGVASMGLGSSGVTYGACYVPGTAAWFATATNEELHANGYTTASAVVNAPSAGEVAYRNSWHVQQATNLATVPIAAGSVVTDTFFTGASFGRNLLEGNYRDAMWDGLGLGAMLAPAGLGRASRMLASEQALAVRAVQTELRAGLMADLAASTKLAPLDGMVVGRAVGNVEMLPSGAGMTKLDIAAEKAYQGIRDVRMADVQAVAENTGLSLQDATTLKKHLFFGRHEYPIDGTTLVRARFVADHEIAYAWQTAAKGPLTDGQSAWFNQLAQHELVERGFMAKGVPNLQRDAWTGSSFGTMPPGAHNLAPKPPNTSFPGYNIPMSLLGD